MEIHEIHLDSVRKYRNPSEYTTINRATCGSYSSQGYGDNIASVAKSMHEDGLSGMVVVKRGDMVVAGPMELSVWSSGRAGRSVQPDHLRRRASYGVKDKIIDIAWD